MKSSQPTDLQRLDIRHRPEGRAIMHQSWGKLLFMHWRIDEKLLRPMIPAALEPDTFDGSAWIAIAPFTMWDIRAFPPFLPAVPGLSAMHELNVRTYVHRDGVPGVWFFSLDCESSAAVLAARTLFHLPYFNAEMKLEQYESIIDYSSQRTDKPAASFAAQWQIGEMLPLSKLGSLAFFLTERYCLYSEDDDEVYRARIHHEPWRLQRATLKSFDSTMIEALGVPGPQGEPVLHYAEAISVDIWPLEEAG